MPSIAGLLLRSDSDADIEAVLARYRRCAGEVKALPTAGVSEALVTTSHRWADAWLAHAEAIAKFAAASGEDAEFREGLVQMLPDRRLGHRPEPHRLPEDNDAWQAVEATFKRTQARTVDFMRACHELGFEGAKDAITRLDE